MHLIVRNDNGERVADGTPEQVIVQLLCLLDTQQLHNLQTVECQRVRQQAVMDPARVPPIVVPAPSAECGWDHDAEFDSMGHV